MVNYKWSFIKGQSLKGHGDPLHDDEGVDMESEIETEDSSTASLGFQPTTEGGVAYEHDHTPSETHTSDNSKHVPVKLATPTFVLEDLPTILSRSLPPSEPSQSPTDHEEEEEEEPKGNELHPQPWQSVVTPFQRTSIEQVHCTYGIQIYMYMYTVCVYKKMCALHFKCTCTCKLSLMGTKFIYSFWAV